MAALENRVNELADATRAARDAQAARDRDIGDLAVRVDANRSAINGLGEQARERFDSLERTVDNGFTEMRGKLDATSAGQQQIVSLLNTIIGQQGEPDPDDQ